MISDSFATFEILIKCTFFVVSPFLQLLMVRQEHSQQRLIDNTCDWYQVLVTCPLTTQEEHWASIN